MAHAAKNCLVTVEEISSQNLFDSEQMAAGTIPALYVSAVVEAKQGAWPLGLWNAYEPDDAALRAYATLAKTQAGFHELMGRWLEQPPLAAE